MSVISLQLIAARALLGWSREECARIIGLATETIQNIETEKFRPTAATVEKILYGLAGHGIELIGQRRVSGVLMVLDQSDNRSQKVIVPVRSSPEAGFLRKSRIRLRLKSKDSCKSPVASVLSNEGKKS